MASVKLKTEETEKCWGCGCRVRLEDHTAECPALTKEESPLIRKFESGATRDTDENKLDYAGFFDPAVLRAYAEYMHKHRVQSDGNLRPSDNWKKGIPKEQYLKSGCRHFMDWYLNYEGYHTGVDMKEALCALMFNVQGFLFEVLKDERFGKCE